MDHSLQNRVLVSDMILRIGEFDLSDDIVPFNFTERRVQLVVPHPRFFGPAKTFEHDLALIRFYDPVSDILIELEQQHIIFILLHVRYEFIYKRDFTKNDR
jgi:hypothetical protein